MCRRGVGGREAEVVDVLKYLKHESVEQALQHELFIFAHFVVFLFNLKGQIRCECLSCNFAIELLIFQ